MKRFGNAPPTPSSESQPPEPQSPEIQSAQVQPIEPPAQSIPIGNGATIDRPAN
jgi:hypothetical protein